MSFDIGLSKNGDCKLSFTIGYSAWGLLDTIFKHKNFWFDNINEKSGEETISFLEEAIDNLKKLPEEGVIREKEYSKGRYIALMNQLEYILENSKNNMDYIWDVSL